MPESTRKSETARPQLPTRTPGPLSVRTATPPVEAYPQGRAYPTERRNLASRQALLRRITVEYDEMPGLRLTAAQAQRLFGLREEVCTRVLHALVDVAILKRDVNGSYARDGVRP
jgi:hypothetical protein